MQLKQMRENTIQVWLTLPSFLDSSNPTYYSILNQEDLLFLVEVELRGMILKDLILLQLSTMMQKLNVRSLIRLNWINMKKNTQTVYLFCKKQMDHKSIS